MKINHVHSTQKPIKTLTEWSTMMYLGQIHEGLSLSRKHKQHLSSQPFSPFFFPPPNLWSYYRKKFYYRSIDLNSNPFIWLYWVLLRGTIRYSLTIHVVVPQLSLATSATSSGVHVLQPFNMAVVLISHYFKNIVSSIATIATLEGSLISLWQAHKVHLCSNQRLHGLV